MSHLRQRLSGLLLLLTLAVAPLATAYAALPLLPPLNDPPSGERYPGKFVWADLFTNDIDTTRAFYAEVFDWEWRWLIDSDAQRYGMFYNDGEAVAGIVRHLPPNVKGPYGRWVHYIAVADVAATSRAIVAGGGRELLARRSYAARGEYAILTDTEKAVFGLLDSSSGDPGDYQVPVGGWLWRQHYSRDPGAASRFYADLFGYEVHAPDQYDELADFVLASDGFARAAVGQLKEQSTASPQWLGIIRVTDLKRVLRRTRANGGTVLLEPSAEIAGGDLAIIVDPLGTSVGVMRWNYADAGSGTGHGGTDIGPGEGR